MNIIKERAHLNGTCKSFLKRLASNVRVKKTNISEYEFYGFRVGTELAQHGVRKNEKKKIYAPETVEKCAGRRAHSVLKIFFLRLPLQRGRRNFFL